MSSIPDGLVQALTHLRADQAPAKQWRDLCDYLGRCPADLQAQLVTPLAARLREFPDAVRQTPNAWILAQRSGQTMPALALCKALVWTQPRLSDAQCADLLQTPGLSGLTHIKLFGQGLSDRFAQWLAKQPLSTVRSLNLTSNEIGCKGACALASSKRLTQLRRLFLGRNKIEDKGATWLVTHAPQLELELLDLRENAISPPIQAQLEQSMRSAGIELRLHAAAPPSQASDGLTRRKKGRSRSKKPSHDDS